MLKSNIMRYLLFSLIFLLTGTRVGIAQKNKPYLAAKPEAGTINTAAPKMPAQQLEDTNVVSVAEKQAISGFNITEFVAARFQYPSAVLEDSNFVAVRIMVEFIVEKNASISGIKIKRIDNLSRTILLPETERLLKQEVLRVMRTLPNWQSPAFQNGVAVRSYYNLPIQLRIE